MINVYMDDLRPCPKGFILTRSVDKCMKILSSKRIHTLSLDHDMGFGKPTGYDLVKYMVKKKLFAKKIIIHSANPFGRYRMVQLLKQHLPNHIELSIMPEPLYFKK